jgi:HEPN domain-containing protein
MPPKLEIVHFWLAKASTDLSAARRLLLESPVLMDAGCLHCHQAVEKAVKGILQLHEIEPPRTHSLARLAGLCRPFHPALADMLVEHEWLTPFAGDVRYPPFPAALSREVASRALAAAERIFDMVVNHVPPEARP